MQRGVTQGASDKQEDSLACFPLQAVHLCVTSDWKIPGGSTGKEEMGPLCSGDCQSLLRVTVCPSMPRTARLVPAVMVNSAPFQSQTRPQVQTISYMVALLPSASRLLSSENPGDSEPFHSGPSWGGGGGSPDRLCKQIVGVYSVASLGM